MDIDVKGSTVIHYSVCDKPANLDIKIADNYFCFADHEQEIFLTIYNRISRETDVKMEGDANEEGTSFDAVFPPLPGPGTDTSVPCTREDNPKKFDRSEELRAKRLEMPKWSIVNQPHMKRRKTNTTASAIPKA